MRASKTRSGKVGLRWFGQKQQPVGSNRAVSPDQRNPTLRQVRFPRIILLARLSPMSPLFAWQVPQMNQGWRIPRLNNK